MCRTRCTRPDCPPPSPPTRHQGRRTAASLLPYLASYAGLSSLLFSPKAKVVSRETRPGHCLNLVDFGSRPSSASSARDRFRSLVSGHGIHHQPHEAKGFHQSPSAKRDLDLNRPNQPSSQLVPAVRTGSRVSCTRLCSCAVPVDAGTARTPAATAAPVPPSPLPRRPSRPAAGSRPGPGGPHVRGRMPITAAARFLRMRHEGAMRVAHASPNGHERDAAASTDRLEM